MANIKITELPVTAAVHGTDLIEKVNDPTGAKVSEAASISQIVDYIATVDPLQVAELTVHGSTVWDVPFGDHSSIDNQGQWFFQGTHIVFDTLGDAYFGGGSMILDHLGSLLWSGSVGDKAKLTSIGGCWLLDSLHITFNGFAAQDAVRLLNDGTGFLSGGAFTLDGLGNMKFGTLLASKLSADGGIDIQKKAAINADGSASFCSGAVNIAVNGNISFLSGVTTKAFINATDGASSFASGSLAFNSLGQVTTDMQILLGASFGSTPDSPARIEGSDGSAYFSANKIRLNGDGSAVFGDGAVEATADGQLSLGADCIFVQTGSGPILKSPDGTKWRIKVSNLSGLLSTELVP